MFILLLLQPILNGKAQVSKKMPINPDFINYFKLQDSLRRANVKINKSLGYVPMTFQLGDVNIVNTSENVKGLKSSFVLLPSSYDLRQIHEVSSVKNQGSGAAGGNCWAFATLSSIESDWMVKSFPEFELSEKNLVCCNGFLRVLEDGGNNQTAMAYLTNLKGPINETDDPYSTISTNSACVSGKPVVACVPEVRWVYKNRNYTKRIIMDYGAVTSAMYMDLSYFNSNDFTYYYNGTSIANHMILIAGWDDNIVTAGGKGAWIVKNSWGDAWADKGYFYISYKDSKILNPIAYYPVRWGIGTVNNETVDQLYSYCKLCALNFIGTSHQSETGIVSEEYFNNKPQYIRKVGTFLAKTGATVEIEILDAENNILSSYKSDPVRSPGYYTFDIPTLVLGNFSIEVTYFTPDLYTPIPIEIKLNNPYPTDPSDTAYADPIIEPSGRQWILENGNWQPLGSNVPNWECDLVISAYAQNSWQGPKANFNMSKYEVCAGSSVQFTDNSASLENISSYFWDFGKNANPATATGKGPHTVLYDSSATPGLRYAKLVVSNSLGTDSIIKEFKIPDMLSIFIAAPDSARLDDTIKLYAFGNADNFTWYPSDYLNTPTGKEVFLKGNIDGYYRYTVTGTQGNCIGGVTFELLLRKSPPNDSICHAIDLHIGDNGPFTNQFAGIQKNEPYPTDTCCNCPMTWCYQTEGSPLQNSVWFKITGPPSGYVNIDTRGMDTEIAVYKSDSCTNITKADLVAANDDYHSEYPYSAALYGLSLIPGQTYWVQVAGSEGGVEGTFYITVSEMTTISDHKTIGESSLSVVPNPSNGKANLQYSSPYDEKFTVSLFDLTGKTVFIKQSSKNSGQITLPLDLNMLPKGLYFVKVNSNMGNLTAKCILQ